MFMTKSQTQCQTFQFFSGSNSLRLPVNSDTSSKNTDARIRFEHLDNNRFSKTFIVQHKSHQITHFPQVSMYKWWILLESTRGSKHIGPRSTAFCVESDFVKSTRCATAKERFLYLDKILLKEPTYWQLIKCFFHEYPFFSAGQLHVRRQRQKIKQIQSRGSKCQDWLYLGRRKILILGRCRCKGCWNVHLQCLNKKK